jgi:hypothetical protein
MTMMIRWHVDDFMISHLEQEEIMQVVQQIKDIYGKKLKRMLVLCMTIWG